MSHQMQGEIASLSAELSSIDDPRRCILLIQQRIRACREAGWPVPEELVRMERNMQTECMAESQGR